MEHLEALRAVTEAFEREIPRIRLDRGTAALRWTGNDLVAHLGAVHRWAAEIVRTGHRQPRTNVPRISGSPLEWYSESRRILLETLDATDPMTPVWTHQRSHRVVYYWHRRQLHETLVHLWDLRSVEDPLAPPPAEVTPALHVDNVDELFEVIATKRAEQERVSLPGPLHLQATDHARHWTIHPDFSCEPVERGRRGALVTGSAGALMLFAWDRYLPDHPRLEVSGDARIVDVFRRAHIRP